MKRICLLMAVLAFAACQSNVKKDAGESLNPRTELIGQLDKGCLGDSITIALMDGIHEDKFMTYPIFDDMFAIPLETDIMTLGSMLITYDGGVSTSWFVPEGGKIFVNMTERGKITVTTEKENSLTKQYIKMAKDHDRFKTGFIHKVDSISKSRGYSLAQKDSLGNVMMPEARAFIREQAMRTVKDPKNKGNILGVLSILNLLQNADFEEVKAVFREMDPVVRNHPALPDSLKN